jgi:protein TonB
MFEDFAVSPVTTLSRRRLRRSFAAAAVMYGTASAAIVAATTSIVSRAPEIDVVPVYFRPPAPAPETPPDRTPARKLDKPGKATRHVMPIPKDIPKEGLKESEKRLADTENGLIDAHTELGAEIMLGVGPPVNPPPPPPIHPRVERLTPPIRIGIEDRPSYPISARRKGIEGVVVVEFDVLEDGRVANLKVLSGPPELWDAVIRIASKWRYTPAHRGSTAVQFHMRRSVVFRLQDA